MKINGVAFKMMDSAADKYDRPEAAMILREDNFENAKPHQFI
jgi:hypothetical protein